MANWSQIQSVFFRGDMIHETLTQGLPNAFKTPSSTPRAPSSSVWCLGTMLALMRLSSVGPYRWIATTHIEFFRSLPAIVVFIAFGLLPLAFNGLVIPFDPYGHRLDCAGTGGCAYMAETIRAGIQAVPKGQVGRRVRSGCRPRAPRRARSCSPQAFRIITPPLTNELILLVKDSPGLHPGLSAQGFELTKYGRATPTRMPT